MANDRSNTGGNVIAGGNMKNVIATTGEKNTVTATLNDLDAEGRKQVFQALTAIQAGLSALSGPTASEAKSVVGEAMKVAEQKKPNKDEIGKRLDTVLRVARQSAEFADVAKKFEPHVERAAHWLGGRWTNLTNLLT